MRAVVVVVLAVVCVVEARALDASGPAQPEPVSDTPVALPDAPEVADLRPLLEPIRERASLIGLVGVVIEDGRIVAGGATGTRASGSDEPVTIDDRFHLGSCTKSMTATLIAGLIEEGTLRWDTTVGEVLGTEMEGRIDPAFRAVTLEMLLTHHAGTPAGLDAGGLWRRLWRGSRRPGFEQRRDLVEGVLGAAPVNEPGGTYLYSNAGFAIAGHMAETVTGEPWEDMMRRRLFEPLGMTSAGFGAPGVAGAMDEPRGHRGGKPVEPGPGADNPAAIGPAGTVHASLPDWARYVMLHIRGARAEDGLMLTPGTFERLHEARGDSGYAKGWLVTERAWAGPSGRVLTHSGSNTMWYAVVWVAPERGLAVMVATNSGGAEAAEACDKASWALIRSRPVPDEGD